MYRDSEGSRNEKIAELKSLLSKKAKPAGSSSSSPSPAGVLTDGGAETPVLEPEEEAGSVTGGPLEIALSMVEKILGSSASWGDDEWGCVHAICAELPADCTAEDIVKHLGTATEAHRLGSKYE